ncbi:MAG: DUF937 domain-containing protein [Acidobacteria bacterium]|nr:DUF937 domain-containing protein [Acidobacteriota bacterium]
MSSLQEILGQELGDQAINQISQSVGVDPGTANSVVQAALPHLINGLATNASTPDGASSLNNALDQHDGSILNDLGGLASSIFGGGGQAASPATDAGGILSHILGGSQGAVTQTVSQQTGVDTGQVAQIIVMLAPIIMSYLGQQKQAQGVGADGLGSLITSALGGGQPASGGLLSMAAGMLDRDHDGSAVDDIASAAFNYLKNRG